MTGPERLPHDDVPGTPALLTDPLDHRPDRPGTGRGYEDTIGRS